MSWQEDLADMDQALLDPSSGFGESVTLVLASGESRPVFAVVDISSQNAGIKGGGSVRSVSMTADLKAADVVGVRKNDSLIYAGITYQIIAHPAQLDSSMWQLKLGSPNNDRELPDIRY